MEYIDTCVSWHMWYKRFKMIPTCVVVLFLSCQKSPALDTIPTFNNIPETNLVVPAIAEASGMADSKINPGYLWVLEDSGNPPHLILLGYDGKVKKQIHIEGVVNRDWEDMAVSGGPLTGRSYVYIADIGDNNSAYASCIIYRFEEPSVTTDTVYSFDKIQFIYPDGAHDAEAMLVDDITKDIYILTKRDNPSRIYKLAYPQNTSGTNTAQFVGQLAYGGITGATMSADGKEIIVKTYPVLNLYFKKPGETIAGAFNNSPLALPYLIEPQGEAVALRNDNKGYYTLSESVTGVAVTLNYYKRK